MVARGESLKPDVLSAVDVAGGKTFQKDSSSLSPLPVMMFWPSDDIAR